MKGVLIGVLLFISFYPAQGLAQSKNFGLKFGVGSAGVYQNPVVDGRVRGFSLYGFYDLNISHSFFSTIDLGVTQRGFKSTQNETTQSGGSVKKVTATSRTTYLSLEPFVNVMFLPTSLPIYLGIAPRFDLLIKRDPGELKFTSGTYKIDLVNDLDRFAFGTSLVLGYKNISIAGVRFRLEGKYEVDITDSMSKYPAKYRNNVLMFLLGVNL